MKTAQLLVFLLGVDLAIFAQAPVPATPPAPATTVSASAILPQLDRLQSAASQTNSELAYLRIEKWKADTNSKQEAQSNADSIQRNLAEALPALIGAVRSAPQDVSAQFKLYRNLNALYDVLASLTESAGAFGPKNDYEALARQLGVIDSVRRSLGDNLEALTASTQTELNQLRTQVQTLQQKAAAAPPVAPKKVIVDDNEAPKKSTHKKKSSQSTSSSGSSSSTPSTSSGNSSTAPTKQQ